MTTRLTRNRETYQSMIPNPPSKRSIFPAKWNRKQTMNASFITPITCKRVIPGQTTNLDLSAFIRLNTQLVCPIDNLFVETFFFYAPDRIAWDNFREFIGEIKNPTQEQVERLVPQIEIPAEKNTAGSLFNLLSASRINKKVKVSKIPFVLHNMIFNRFFRDPDCQDYKPVDTTDTAGDIDDYDLYRIHKSRDFFTNATRDVQIGEPVTIPFATTAPVISDGSPLNLIINGNTAGSNLTSIGSKDYNDKNTLTLKTATSKAGDVLYNNAGLIADMTNSKATLDALAQAIMTQQYLQALNRGGTKYTDIMSNIYDVDVFDYSIQEPMYLGGTHSPLFTTPVVQTSGTGMTG